MPRFVRWLFLPYAIFYRFFVEWVLCVEIPWKTHIGKDLQLFHGVALVINDRTIVGDNCVLRHSTTIGVANTSADFSGGAPVLGNNVDVGSNVVILGNITIGNNVSIGAGSVVVKDIPEGAVVVGNPARVIRIKSTEEIMSTFAG
jgi:putative colanic acid biosynthesis acetyltransferase WcaB